MRLLQRVAVRSYFGQQKVFGTSQVYLFARVNFYLNSDLPLNSARAECYRIWMLRELFSDAHRVEISSIFEVRGREAVFCGPCPTVVSEFNHDKLFGSWFAREIKSSSMHSSSGK